MNIKYYYYPPTNPQFFFPVKEFKSFNSYYSPYSFVSKLFWLFFKNSSLLRKFFIINEEKIPLPINIVKSLFNEEFGVFFFNLGTSGEQQKASIIASFDEIKYFMKFAQNHTSKKLISNEIEKLLYLESAKVNSARIINHGTNNKYAFLITNVIPGTKISLTKINSQIMKLLFSISEIDMVKNRGDYVEVFSHGDFCPWNMLINENNEISLIDWEMAGLKPLGFDLFTFIFQTSFLLSPKMKIRKILNENKADINKYFNNFQIIDWEKYLIKFSKIKILEEKEKSNSQLLLKYKEILEII